MGDFSQQGNFAISTGGLFLRVWAGNCVLVLNRGDRFEACNVVFSRLRPTLGRSAAFL